MSVKRKGPKATVVRVATYGLLVLVAIVVLFPFVVAVATSFKDNKDIFSYPPSLVPERASTVPNRA
jgi:ABC-type glycerol-3-phosphate transport system permease component